MSRCVRARRIGWSLVVLIVAAAQSKASACPFCVARGPTLAQQIDAADDALLAELVSSSEHEATFRPLVWLKRAADERRAGEADKVSLAVSLPGQGRGLFLLLGEATAEPRPRRDEAAPPQGPSTCAGKRRRSTKPASPTWRSCRPRGSRRPNGCAMPRGSWSTPIHSWRPTPISSSATLPTTKSARSPTPSRKRSCAAGSPTQAWPATAKASMRWRSGWPERRPNVKPTRPSWPSRSPHRPTTSARASTASWPPRCCSRASADWPKSSSAFWRIRNRATATCVTLCRRLRFYHDFGREIPPARLAAAPPSAAGPPRVRRRGDCGPGPLAGLDAARSGCGTLQRAEVRHAGGARGSGRLSLGLSRAGSEGEVGRASRSTTPRASRRPRQARRALAA